MSGEENGFEVVWIALAHMYIKDYRKASELESTESRKALFMTGFCYYMSKDYTQARNILNVCKKNVMALICRFVLDSTILPEEKFAKALEVANQLLDNEHALQGTCC